MRFYGFYLMVILWVFMDILWKSVVFESYMGIVFWVRRYEKIVCESVQKK